MQRTALKLHIDTDLGGDIDDLCALAMALHWPGADLLAVTTAAEHQGKRARYARYVLGLAGREDIPVAVDADVSLDCCRYWQGLPDEEVYWPLLTRSARLRDRVRLEGWCGDQ